MAKPDIRVATFAGPGAKPVIETVPWPAVPKNAALIKIGACGVCGTDQHILKGHWPKPLPWPFTLGHEIGGVIVEKGEALNDDFMGKPIAVGSKIMIPPLMPCGRCYYCVHYPENANKCLTPVYYGRYLGFTKPPHLWGGWAEYVYVDLDMLPGTKIYKLYDDMSLRLGALSEPLTSCIRAFNRATRAGGFRWGDTVVIQGSGPIGILAVAAAQEMGAGRVICVGAPEEPRLKLARKFGAEATVNIEETKTPAERIARVREIVGGFGADLVMDCSGHPSAGPEGIEMLRDGGTYVEMGQFTDAGKIETSWHRICAKDLNVLGSWAFTGNDLPLGVDMLYRARDKYPWLEMQTIYPFTEEGVSQAVADAMAMKTVKSTIVPWPELVEAGAFRDPPRPRRRRPGPVRPPRAVLCRVPRLLCRPARGSDRPAHARPLIRGQRRRVLGRRGRARAGLRLHRRRLPERRGRGAAPALRAPGPAPARAWRAADPARRGACAGSELGADVLLVRHPLLDRAPPLRAPWLQARRGHARARGRFELGRVPLREAASGDADLIGVAVRDAPLPEAQRRRRDELEEQRDQHEQRRDAGDPQAQEPGEAAEHDDEGQEAEEARLLLDRRHRRPEAQADPEEEPGKEAEMRVGRDARVLVAGDAVAEHHTGQPRDHRHRGEDRHDLLQGPLFARDRRHCPHSRPPLIERRKPRRRTRKEGRRGPPLQVCSENLVRV
jgi:threonine dehydrogenase-like Zn-dependent dehydrogenase